MFRKAQRTQTKLRIALTGPSGSGKTYSALLLAQGLGGQICLLDSERGSADLYADLIPDGFSKTDVEVTSPHEYIKLIGQAESDGYSILIIDSLSHEWVTILERVDQLRATSVNQFSPWSEVSPRHKALINRILSADMHVICTLRTKTAWDFVEYKGRKKPVKIGLKPEQREGIEYEFTTVFRIDENHTATIEKDRSGLFKDFEGILTRKEGDKLRKWLQEADPKELKNSLNSTSPTTNTEEQYLVPNG